MREKLKQLMHYLVWPPQADDQHLLKVTHLLSLTAWWKRKRHYLLKSFKPYFIPYLWKVSVWRTKEITGSAGRQSTLEIRPALWKMDRRPKLLPASAKPRVPAREVCENTKSGSPDATAAEAQSVRRGLHLMPDCPNLLQNSGLNSPGVRLRGWESRRWRREGTVIVPRSVEIFFWAALSKRKAVPW